VHISGAIHEEIAPLIDTSLKTPYPIVKKLLTKPIALSTSALSRELRASQAQLHDSDKRCRAFQTAHMKSSRSPDLSPIKNPLQFPESGYNKNGFQDFLPKAVKNGSGRN
jgi:hypothetical protein